MSSRQGRCIQRFMIRSSENKLFPFNAVFIFENLKTLLILLSKNTWSETGDVLKSAFISNEHHAFGIRFEIEARLFAFQ